MQIMEQLNIIELNKDKDDITLVPTLNCQNQPKQSVIVESQASNKGTILKDKSQKPKKTSVVDSTISIAGLNPYWNAQCEVINSKLWLPIKGLDSSLFSKTLDGSWFSNQLIVSQNNNLPTIFSAFFMSSDVECKDLEITKAKSVKLYPTKTQRQTFKKWHNCSRYVFNQTIDYIRSCVNFSPSWMDIRKDLLRQLPKWYDDVPFQINGNAVKEAHQAYWKAKGHPKLEVVRIPHSLVIFLNQQLRMRGFIRVFLEKAYVMVSRCQNYR